MFTLEPKTVALIGASGEEKKLGHYILKNLLESGFTGKILPINPKHDELLGTKCFHSVSDVPGSIDMAVVVTPAATVQAIAEECGKKKVKTLVVISAGFGEIGTEEGKKMEHDLKAVCEKYGVSLVGPNCLGVLRPSIGLNASFAATPKTAGNIALISQSGAMAVALLDAASSKQLAFSFIASIGNKTDLDETAFLEVCEDDSKTSIIGLYLESIKDGIKFVEAAKRIAKKKPIVLIKAGVSSRGAKAVSSHTGALAGSSAALHAACQEAGIHLANDTEEFLSMLQTLRASPRLSERTIAIITNAGGPGVLATDASEKAGLILTTLDDKTIATLKKVLPPAASTANPIDVLGDALADRYEAALKACAADPSVEGIVVVLTPQVMTPVDAIAKAVITIRKSNRLVPVTTSFMGGDAVASAHALMLKEGIPSFDTPEEAVKAMATLLEKEERPDMDEDQRNDDRSSAAHQFLKGRKGLLSEEIVQELFQLYDLPTPEQAVATSAEEAVELAEQIGYPVIAKVSSPDILHKTDIGGVRANLKSAAEVKKAYAEIVKNAQKHMPAAVIRGVLIQQLLPAGSEFIVGGIRDASFGPVVMVGLGGIYTELFRDTCFRLAPVDTESAYEMLSELKSWKLLTGMRGKGALDIDALASAIQKISQLMVDCPRIAEIDLNPVLVSKDSISVADAKVVVD